MIGNYQDVVNYAGRLYTLVVLNSTSGRQNQRERTRRAIVAAAARLAAEGKLPTMQEVADEALVSIATAYRYFPDQLSLLRAAIGEGFGGIGERFAPDIGEEPDAVRRVDLATEGMLRRIVERESLVRAVVALSLLKSVEEVNPDGADSSRPAFRIAWIEEALRPLTGQIGARDLRRLKLALGVVMSSEALIALQDVMGTEKEEAIDVCRWMARTLTEAASHEGLAEHAR